MLALLLSGALLAGLGTTAGMGERSPSFSVAADARTRWVGVEALAVAAPKLESGQGWLGTAAAEVHVHKATTGARYSYRDGGSWVKRTWWARVGYGGVRHRVLLERAMTGYNEETKLEYRHRAALSWAVLDVRAFVSRHLQGWGFGSSIMAGIGSVDG